MSRRDIDDDFYMSTDGGMGGQGGQAARNARQKQVRLGNEITLLSPQPGLANSNSTSPKYPILNAQRLLTANSEDYPDSRKGGAWALTLSADKLLDPNVPPMSTVSSPLVARVTYGSGGISSSFLVDAWNTSLVIPADSVMVEVGYTEVSPFSYPGVTDLYPAEAKVIGTLARVASSGGNGALLTRRINATSFGTLDAITIDVPRFATSWSICNGQVPGPGSAEWQSAQIRGVGSSLDYVDNLYLDAQKESVAFRTLPPAAVAIVFTPAILYAQAFVLFNIEL